MKKSKKIPDFIWKGNTRIMGEDKVKNQKEKNPIRK